MSPAASAPSSGAAQPPRRVAFQGEPGAYSHQACRETCPQMEALPCRTFEDAIEATRSGRADMAMLPVENTTYGRVADIHSLLPNSGLHIVAEAFVRVHINLLAVPGTPLEAVREAVSHTVLLGQCRAFLRDHAIHPVVAADTAGAARTVAADALPARAALASELAGEIYGLEVLARHIEDQSNNTTRFLLMARAPDWSRRGRSGMMTALVFRVRNIPAALYKAMGGFATNGVNMTKLESYMVGGSFTATQFFAEVEGHPEDENLARALEELRYFTSQLTILGVYPADPRRH
ncbi:prephenate dehydratase [Rhodobaculum claviforme]|uniref:prephenate dehydratase n=1 Tax=Rhodobaculum claviforme TaxID=1549854 RepID=A0A934TML0_9RHOB|nr:prephenate dehydratase [Rhodobaculum claviforme]MBK5928281.1 prephenate dehydratase [Rhodobaculum claviforme]